MQCGDLIENAPHRALFEYLVSSWQNCLGRILRCGILVRILAGRDVSLGDRL